MSVLGKNISVATEKYFTYFYLTVFKQRERNLIIKFKAALNKYLVEMYETFLNLVRNLGHLFAFHVRNLNVGRHPFVAHLRDVSPLRINYTQRTRSLIYRDDSKKKSNHIADTQQMDTDLNNLY